MVLVVNCVFWNADVSKSLESKTRTATFNSSKGSLHRDAWLKKQARSLNLAHICPPTWNPQHWSVHFLFCMKTFSWSAAALLKSFDIINCHRHYWQHELVKFQRLRITRNLLFQREAGLFCNQVTSFSLRRCFLLIRDLVLVQLKRINAAEKGMTNCA